MHKLCSGRCEEEKKSLYEKLYFESNLQVSLKQPLNPHLKKTSQYNCSALIDSSLISVAGICLHFIFYIVFFNNVKN